jgi:cell division protein FtsB
MSTRPQFQPLESVVRLAPEPPESDPYHEEMRRRRRRRLLAAGMTVLLLAVAFVAWEVRSAAAHYERGKQALADEQYYAAIQELDAARIVVFSYRDAEALSAEAREALDAGIAEAVRSARLEDTVRRLVERADAFVAKGAAEDVERVLAEARERVPDGPLTTNVLTVSLIDALTTKIGSAAREAIRATRWSVAGSYARALLAIDPEDEEAARLAARADLGAKLERQLGDARAAARRGQWRQALRLAQEIVAEWPGFPGAAALVREARTALKPEPTPEPTVVPTPTPPPATQPPAPTKPTPPPP